MPALNLTCPHCGRSLTADDSQRGRAVACPSCQGKLRVPSAPEPATRVATITSVTPDAPPETASDSGPLLTLRPTLVVWVTVMQSAIFGLICALIASFHWFFFGRFLGSGGLYAGAGLAFLIPAVAYFYGRKRSCARTVYRFYRDRLEYRASFLGVNDEIIRYDKITEIALKRIMLQRSCGLGTLYIAMADVGGVLSIADIENPEQALRVIQELIARRNQPPGRA